MQGASIDRRSIGHGIVREDIKEREVESLNTSNMFLEPLCISYHVIFLLYFPYSDYAICGNVTLTFYFTKQSRHETTSSVVWAVEWKETEMIFIVQVF